MQYMLLCCIDEREWNGLPQAARDGVMRDYHALIDELATRGAYVIGGKLQDSATATTVRGSASRPVLTDGPFAETKEQLGGFHIVECRDLDAAIAIARRIPTLPVGGRIEVRPLVALEGPLSKSAGPARPMHVSNVMEDA
jgi:hypothetical protein